MKIVVIGGTGLIGSKVVSKLTQLGHEAIAAAHAETKQENVVASAIARSGHAKWQSVLVAPRAKHVLLESQGILNALSNESVFRIVR